MLEFIKAMRYAGVEESVITAANISVWTRGTLEILGSQLVPGARDITVV